MGEWEIKQSFDGQLYHEYVYQKLLKWDNPSSSYGKKNFGVFMPHSIVRPTAPTVLQCNIQYRSLK